MKLRKVEANAFEKLAFESALRAHPGDTTAAGVYRDWLQEQGYTAMHAGRIVTRTIREATELWMCDRTRELIAEDPVFRHKLFTELRGRCPLLEGPHFEIVIVPGPLPPTWVPYWVTGPECSEQTQDVLRRLAQLPDFELGSIGRVELRVGATWVRSQFSVPRKYCLPE